MHHRLRSLPPLFLIFASLMWTTAAPAAVQSQPPEWPRTPDSRGSTSGTMPISAAAMATFMASYTGADETLDLLVLWRGTPGWFAKGGRSGSSGGGRSGGAQQHRFYEGAYEFEVTLDRTTGKAHVLDRDIDVATANAVFVDEVDASRGPRIAKTMLLTNRTLDTTLRGPNQIVALMGKIPEVREYVGCETRLPDERLQARLAPICALLVKPPVTSR